MDNVDLADMLGEKKVVKNTVFYEMGEEIQNGIIFWRFVTGKKDSHKRAECICHCGKKWNVDIVSVRAGITKGCGCKRRKGK